MSSRLTLDNGLVTLNRLQAVRRDGDDRRRTARSAERELRYALQRVLGGWKGEGKLIDRLKQTAIPLRIYGEWQSLSYSLWSIRSCANSCRMSEAAPQRLG